MAKAEETQDAQQQVAELQAKLKEAQERADSEATARQAAEERAAAADSEKAKAEEATRESHEEGRESKRKARVDAVILFDGIGWREQFDGPIMEQRASTTYQEAIGPEGNPEVSLPGREFDRLEALGAVAKSGSKQGKARLEALGVG